jgi:hypothetical protein
MVFHHAGMGSAGGQVYEMATYGYVVPFLLLVSNLAIGRQMSWWIQLVEHCSSSNADLRNRAIAKDARRAEVLNTGSFHNEEVATKLHSIEGSQ